MKIQKLKGGFHPFLTEDEKMMATTNSRNIVYVYNVEDGKLLHSLKTLSNISKTAISRDKKLLAAKNTSGTIIIISLETEEEICRSAMEGREGYDAMHFTPDSSALLDFDWDGRTMLLDYSTGEHRILDGAPRSAGNQVPYIPHMQYDVHTDLIYKFMSKNGDLKDRVMVSPADANNIVFHVVQEFAHMLPQHSDGISLCRTNNYYVDGIHNQLVVTDKNFSELSRRKLPAAGVTSFNKVWVSANEKYLFMDFGKQCDYRDFAASKTAKSLSCLFALDTMEQVAEFDYDYVSDFLMFDEDRRFVIATWKGSYMGTL